MRRVQSWIAAGVCLLAFFVVSSTVSAEHTGRQDTDLFMVHPNLIDEEGAPNVMIIIDNTANWNRDSNYDVEGCGKSKFCLVKEALGNVFEGIRGDTDAPAINVGMMLFTDQETGAYVRFAVQSLSDESVLNELIEMIENFTAGGGDTDQGNNAAYALALHEAYLYFKGKNSRAGHTSPRLDERAFAGNLHPHHPTQYQKPLTGVCATDNIIFISNGAPDSSENNPAKSELTSLLGGSPAQIYLDDKQARENWMDEYARFLAGEGINTYTINVLPPRNEPEERTVTSLLPSAARHGNGQYYEVEVGADLEFAFADILDRIQAVDSVFAATSLPVSVNTRGTHLNEVYMAMFRPSAESNPRWYGNLKMYQLRRFDDGIHLADALENKAQNAETGFLEGSAVSFWTHSSGDYWETLYPDAPTDYPDGPIVEKGGAAQMMRIGYQSRQLYTCGSDCASGIPYVLNSTSVNPEDFGLDSGDTAERDDIIDWIYGADNHPQNPERVDPQDSHGRPSIHGDVVHSSPAVINFNRTGDDDDIVVFYGANDGQLRAVRGGAVSGRGTAGEEIWSFISKPHLPLMVRLRDNDPLMLAPSELGDPDNKPYAVDGNITQYTVRNSEGEIVKAHIFATMRRGGRFLVALDVSTPEEPKFMWQVGCSTADDSSCTNDDYKGIGQTWSDAVVRRANIDGENKMVLIMGAGYDDLAEDSYPAESAERGKGIFIIDAETGDVLTKITHDDMDSSFPASVTALNDPSGNVYRLYAPDAGGSIWRVDMDSPKIEQWTVRHLAELGGDGSDTRKFLHSVDVVDQGSYYSLLIGSGDREKPYEDVVQNRFYMIRDTGDSGSWPIKDADLYDATLNLIQEGEDAEAELALLADAQGWFINLHPGEKVVGASQSVAGSTFFATNQPDLALDSEVCESDLGIARTYIVSTADATAVIERDNIAGLTRADRDARAGSDVGYLPTPTYAFVNLDPDGLDLGEVMCFGPECIEIPDGIDSSRVRTFWFKEVD